jgi:tetratricopeptide (TPR) repeat protein
MEVNFEMKRTAFLGLWILVILAMKSMGIAQGTAPQWKSKAEYDSYNAAYTEKTPAKKAELSEAFINTFKDADIKFRGDAYLMLVKAYSDAQNYPKAMDAASKVSEVLPNMPPERMAQVYSIGLDAAAKSDNVQKAVEFGDKVLAIVPEDANTLIMLAALVPERLPTDEAAKRAALDKAEQYGTRAQAVVAKIFSGAKPAAMSDADWANQRATIESDLHANLGFVALNRVDYDKAVSHYEAAIKSNPKNAVAQFRLGLSYSGQASALSKAYLASVDDTNAAIRANAEAAQQEELKAKSATIEASLRAKRDQAIETLATAVALGGVVAQPARDQLVKLYQAKNNGSTEGLDQLIQSKKPQ